MLTPYTCKYKVRAESSDVEELPIIILSFPDALSKTQDVYKTVLVGTPVDVK